MDHAPYIFFIYTHAICACRYENPRLGGEEPLLYPLLLGLLQPRMVEADLALIEPLGQEARKHLHSLARRGEDEKRARKASREADEAVFRRKALHDREGDIRSIRIAFDDSVAYTAEKYSRDRLEDRRARCGGEGAQSGWGQSISYPSELEIGGTEAPPPFRYAMSLVDRKVGGSGLLEKIEESRRSEALWVGYYYFRFAALHCGHGGPPLLCAHASAKERRGYA